MVEKHWTGERLEPHISGEVMLEHLHRYAIAKNYSVGKKVLDIACGEGYGTNLLSKTALSITGIDIDQEVIKNARRKYRSENLTFLHGNILKIPMEDNSVQLIVCFETLEHVKEHDVVINEFKRILEPGGTLIISTPIKETYSEKEGYSNPYHINELNLNEFKALIKSSFQNYFFYTQFCAFASIIIHEGNTSVKSSFTGNYDEISDPIEIPWKYSVAIASDTSKEAHPSDMFIHKQSFQELLENEIVKVKQTKTYKIGNLIVSPLRYILSLFKK